MIITLKIILGLLSVALIVGALMAPSSDQSLEGVFNGQERKEAATTPLTKFVWISFALWLTDALILALLLK